MAGLSACIASNPVDVVRTRMMVQRKTARWWFPTFIFWRFFAKRSSLGLPLHSSYGETLPHTYFKSSLRCGLHTVFTKCCELWNYQEEKLRYSQRGCWHSTRASSQHSPEWDPGMSSSSWFMRNCSIPTHMLVDEITYINMRCLDYVFAFWLDKLHCKPGVSYPLTGALNPHHLFQRAFASHLPENLLLPSAHADSFQPSQD